VAGAGESDGCHPSGIGIIILVRSSCTTRRKVKGKRPRPSADERARESERGKEQRGQALMQRELGRHGRRG
jgi:hypothetical protein